MFVRLSEHMKPSRILTRPHKGVIVDNEDPKKLGRVKCTIDGLMEAGKEDLPWIMPQNYDPQKFDIPEVGQELIIRFPYHDIYSPFYVGFWHSEATHDAYFDDDYPNSFGINKQGFQMKYNKISKEGEIIHPSGSFFKIIEDGSVESSIEKDLTETVKGETTQTFEKKVTQDFLDELVKTIALKYSITADGIMELKSTVQSIFGDGSSNTQINGSTIIVQGNSILLGPGGLPVAYLGASAVGVGNFGAPVVSTIVQGSSKVFVSP